MELDDEKLSQARKDPPGVMISNVAPTVTERRLRTQPTRLVYVKQKRRAQVGRATPDQALPAAPALTA